MKKYKWAIIIILAVAAIYWFYFRKKKTTTTDSSTEKTTDYSAYGGGGGSIWSDTPADPGAPSGNTTVPQTFNTAASLSDKQTYINRVTEKVKRAPLANASLGTVPEQILTAKKKTKSLAIIK
ncbi:MAG: hypothetical protein PHS33_08540 [Candidatus Omnitrophica bacterium]|nr:hypothetical protein [Candidatus Omnitrophota bacterium]